MEKRLKNLIILGFGFLELVLRLAFVNQGLFGDINPFAEWGMQYSQIGSKNFYFYDDWYYTFPAYPPASNLVFAYAYHLSNENIVAKLHNSFKIIPASYVQYFGSPVPGDPFMHTHGYYTLLKLIPIISDILLALVVYKIVLELTKKQKLALVGYCLYLFNPISVFLSGIWGQTESFVALFAILSFYALYKKKFTISLSLLFLSLYTKPTWALLIPFYLYCLYLFKPKIRQIITGLLAVLILFLLTTLPFSGQNVFSFVKDVVLGTMLPSAKGTTKLSISAFNFFTVFWKLDITFTSFMSKSFSVLSFIVLNFIAFKLFNINKNKLVGVLLGIFIIGMGTYLFMDNMLERYFFPGFVPLIVISVIYWKKISREIVIINIVIMLNLIYSFYRRNIFEIAMPFTNNNHLLIRFLSIVIVLGFYSVVRKSMLQFKRG